MPTDQLWLVLSSEEKPHLKPLGCAAEIFCRASEHLCVPQWPRWSRQQELSWSGSWIELRERNLQRPVTKCLLRDPEKDRQSSMTSIKGTVVYIFFQACSWMSCGSEIVVAVRSLRTPLLTSPAPCSFCHCATVVYTIFNNAFCEKWRKGNGC